MKLLCHRGLWEGEHDKNSMAALMRAIDRGFGVETDIRDLDGDLVVSHDPPRQTSAQPLSYFLESYRRAPQQPLLALNIKADGLHDRLKEILTRYDVANYFVFDMSVPDTIGYVRCNMPIAIRLSEYEDGGRMPWMSEFIWLDAFEREWYGLDELSGWLESGRSVCIVSPELHRRPHAKLWRLLNDLPRDLRRRMHLCTDLVSEALEVFDVRQD